MGILIQQLYKKLLKLRKMCISIPRQQGGGLSACWQLFMLFPLLQTSASFVCIFQLSATVFSCGNSPRMPCVCVWQWPSCQTQRLARSLAVSTSRTDGCQIPHDQHQAQWLQRQVHGCSQLGLLKHPQSLGWALAGIGWLSLSWLNSDLCACSLSSSSRLDWTCPKQLSKVPGEIQGTQERPAEALKMFANEVLEVTCPTKGLCAQIFFSKKRQKEKKKKPMLNGTPSLRDGAQ